MGNFAFITELLIAQLILLFNYPKKKYYWLRLLISLACVITIAFFLPLPQIVLTDPLLGFLRFIILLGLSILGMLFCFDCKNGAILSGCIAGYAVQHFTYQIFKLVSLSSIAQQNISVTEVLTFFIVYVIFFFTLGRFISKHNYYENYDDKFIIISAIIVFICVIIYRFARMSATDDITTVCIAIYSMTCCLLSLTIQYFAYSFISLQVSNKTLQNIISQKEQQYKISKQNMDLLNIKCHDLKHQLHSLPQEEKKEIAKIIDIYDNPVKTNLDVLDVTLNEKLKIMYDKKIKINFTGDGQLLNWINDTDIYSLFGNAVDNAIEALDKVQDIDKKIINITLEEKGDLIVVTILNYYTGDIKFKNNEIVTSKLFEEGYHGYGIKSIKYLVNKYHGTLQIHTSDHIFKLIFSFLR